MVCTVWGVTDIIYFIMKTIKLIILSAVLCCGIADVCAQTDVLDVIKSSASSYKIISLKYRKSHSIPSVVKSCVKAKRVIPFS